MPRSGPRRGEVRRGVQQLRPHEQPQHASWSSNETEISHGRVSWQANNLSKAGWSWGCVSAIDSAGRTIWIADAHRDDGKRLIVRADDSKRLWRNDNYVGILKTGLLNNDCGELGIKRGLTQPVL